MSVKFYENFQKAYLKLKDFCSQYDGTEINAAGVIQAFEFTFEQCWKSIQKKAGAEGISVSSPKKSFEWALSNGWIESEDESIWLKMLDDRNLTSHTYREAVARRVAESILKEYEKAFYSMLEKMLKA